MKLPAVLDHYIVMSCEELTHEIKVVIDHALTVLDVKRMQKLGWTVHDDRITMVLPLMVDEQEAHHVLPSEPEKVENIDFEAVDDELDEWK